MGKNGNRTINHAIFDAWNEHSAYLLGFWLADGSIQLYKFRGFQKYQKRFWLYNTELELMKRLGTILGKPPLKRNKPSKPGVHKQCYAIMFSSSQVFDFLYALVKTLHKSKECVEVPPVPDPFFHHFVRGFFDGDGCITVIRAKNRHGKVKPTLHSSFTAGLDTGAFLDNLGARIRAFIPIAPKKSYAGKTNRKLLFAQFDTMLLCEWMYRDATLFMKRKKAIWDAADKERLARSRKYGKKLSHQPDSNGHKLVTNELSYH